MFNYVEEVIFWIKGNLEEFFVFENEIKVLEFYEYDFPLLNVCLIFVSFLVSVSGGRDEIFVNVDFLWFCLERKWIFWKIYAFMA